MSKWKEALEKMKSPPPERLAKIEYQSHFMGMIGVIVASIFLVYKGFWYIIFAFVFSLGVSYSQGMAAYQKYKMILQYTNTKEFEDINQEKSPTRRRTKINQAVFGKRIGWVAAILSIVASFFIINPLTANWYERIALTFLIILIYIVIFFFIFYWIANPIYKKRCKEVNNNGV